MTVKSLGGLVALALPTLPREVVGSVGVVTLLGRETLLDAVTTGTVGIALLGSWLDTTSTTLGLASLTVGHLVLASGLGVRDSLDLGLALRGLLASHQRGNFAR